MDETDLNPKKALIVNLSSIHELRYQITVLNKLCELESSYPCNLLGHAYDFASGKYDQIINNYKIGIIDTDQFIENMIDTAQLDFDNKYFVNIDINNVDYNVLKARRKKELFGKIWNEFIQLEDDSPGCCFFSCPTLSCKKKVQKLIDYAQNENTAVDAIYFISNTNSLNVHKIFSYLREKFPKLIDANIIDNIIHIPEKISDQNKDIRVSQKNKKPEIYLALSYRYGIFKTGQDNQRIGLPTTPDLLGLLCDKFNRLKISNKNLFLISQYDKDLEKANSLGIRHCHADEFYSHPITAVENNKIDEKQRLLV